MGLSQAKVGGGYASIGILERIEMNISIAQKGKEEGGGGGGWKGGEGLGGL